MTVNNNNALGGGGMNGGNAYGGGLYVDPATVTLSGDIVDNNQATVLFNQFAEGNTFGGGLYLAGGTLNLTGDTVDGNFSGGQLSLLLSFDFSFQSYGGGMYVADGTVTLSNDTIENNVANGRGYAIGAGLYIAHKVYIDAFTLAHVISNTGYDDYYPGGTVDNIDGPYILT